MSDLLLDIENLAVRYGPRAVLAGVTLRVRRGELVALLGPNGSGKTTLLRASMGLVSAQGVVRWNASPDVVRSPQRLARLAAYLPQSPTLNAGQTVAQAILLGRFAHRGGFAFADSPDDRRAVAAAAEALGITELLGRRMEQLSGGQRQRVHLARCLAQGAPVLVLDEPATFLDLRNQVELYRLLRRLVRDHDRTVVMACHDLNLAAVHCGRMIVLNEGKLAADGPPERVMDAALIERVYGVAMRRIEVEGRPHLLPVE